MNRSGLRFVAISRRTVVERIGAVVTAVAATVAFVLILPAGEAHAQSTPSGPSSAKVFELVIMDGRLVAASNTIKVKKGDDVELRWSSDRSITLHLHGYDIERKVAPQSTAAMVFKAKLPGRFPVSEHQHGSRQERTLLYLEVHP
jgi:FtsP/CotA-like multicopper oxidase with cupredoxin domain